MATRYRRPIVVGVDGTDAGQAAVRWAAAEVRLRAAPLRIIGAYEPASLAGPLPIPPALRYRFDDALDHARRRLDAEDVDGELIPGHPSRVLRAEARNARLVVLGRRTGGVRSALSVERVTSWVAAHAVCPVAVVRREPSDGSPGRIVVGFDGSRSAVTALDLGLEEAEVCGAALDVVCCWQPEEFAVREHDQAMAVSYLRRRQLEWFADAVAERARKRDGVFTTRHLVEGSPADELVERSRHAELLVVGSRGRDAATGLLLGSVSQELLRRSHCTVIVARSEDDA